MIYFRLDSSRLTGTLVLIETKDIQEEKSSKNFRLNSKQPENNSQDEHKSDDNFSQVKEVDDDQGMVMLYWFRSTRG